MQDEALPCPDCFFSRSIAVATRFLHHSTRGPRSPPLYHPLTQVLVTTPSPYPLDTSSPLAYALICDLSLGTQQRRLGTDEGRTAYPLHDIFCREKNRARAKLARRLLLITRNQESPQSLTVLNTIWKAFDKFGECRTVPRYRGFMRYSTVSIVSRF